MKIEYILCGGKLVILETSDVTNPHPKKTTKIFPLILTFYPIVIVFFATEPYSSVIVSCMTSKELRLAGDMNE